MPFNQKELQLIEWGASNGKSKEEVKQAISNLRNGIVPQPAVKEKPSFLERVTETINQAGSNVDDAIKGEGQYEGASSIRRGTQATAEALNAVTKVGYEALPEVAREGLSSIGEKIGEGFQFVTDKVAQTKLFKEIGELEAQGFLTPEIAPELYKIKEALGTASAGGQISGNILLANQAAKALQTGTNVTTAAAKKAVSVAKEGGSKITAKVADLTEKTPVDIMNRVARLKPTDATKFKQMTGKTQGQYLKDTGNFGSPDKIITKEAVKFAKSKAAVDTELAKLPGKYETGAIKDALEGLYEKAIKTSSSNVPSPYLKQVQDLMAKYNKGGLTMGEINGVKRLFEREVKLGYSKLINPDGVQQATNIDSALRTWQVAQAKTLGFKNIDVLNKQTQTSKFLIDKLGDQVVGQNGLNSVNLTDWIILGGGDPTSVAGFLTKKFFSSKGVQAKVAELLNKGNGITGDVKPDIGLSQVKQLAAPKSGSPKSSINTPINLPSRKAIAQGTEVVTPSKQVLQSPPTKLKSTYNDTLSQTTAKVNALPTSQINTTLERALTSAEQTLGDLSKSELALLGGINKLIEQTLKNIVLELKAKGFADVASKINKIDLSSVKSLDHLDTAILNITKGL